MLDTTCEFVHSLTATSEILPVLTLMSEILHAMTLIRCKTDDIMTYICQVITGRPVLALCWHTGPRNGKTLDGNNKIGWLS